MRRAISVFGAFLLVLTFALAAFAQDSGRLNGEILDKDGKPYADVTVSLKNQETGQVYTIKTDKSGKFVQLGMRGGIYTVTSTNAKDGFNFSEKMLINLDKDNEYKLNGKEAMAQGGRRPKEKKKKNHAFVWGNLGAAEECAGKYGDAASSFQKASDLAPTAGYYTGLATNEANLGASLTDPKESASKFTDANAACDKAVALDPAGGAVCWKNLGIVLSNKGRMKDAITPLQKATTADPKDAQSWFMLGNAMTATIEPKQEGDKMTYIIPPGTKEAYQKAIDLGGAGSSVATQAQAALDGLNAMSGGEDTSIGKKKKK